MPTAQSATTADLTRRLTSLRVTALTASDAVVKQAALDDAEVEVMGRLGGGSFPEYTDLSATGKAIFQGFVLQYAVFLLIERIKGLDEATRADRDRLDAQVDAYRARGAGLEALGEAAPNSPRVKIATTASTTTRVWTSHSMGEF